MALHALVSSSLVVLVAGTLLSAASSQQPKPSFEVASVKPNATRTGFERTIQPGGRFVARNNTVVDREPPFRGEAPAL
jgi:hypothetical protein